MLVCAVINTTLLGLFNEQPAMQQESNMVNHQKLIDQFFHYLSYLGNPENKIDAASLQKYLNNDCIVQSNNEIISHDIDEFIAYINRMQEKYETVSYSSFLEDPILSKNKAVLHFHVSCLTKTGTQRHLDAIAILTFHNGKISLWKEVFQDLENDSE